MYKFRYYFATILWSLFTLQQANAFVLELSVDKTGYVLGEPVVLYVSLKNDSSASTELPQHLLPEYYDVKYMVNDQQFRAWILSDHLEPTKTFAPEEILRQEVKLFCGSRGKWTFPNPGVYNITANTWGQSSNTLTLTVLNSTEEQQAASLILDSTNTCYFLLFEGGGHLTDGIQRLQQLVDQYPDSPLAIYANQALGNNLLMDFTNFTTGAYRPSDPASALPYLEVAQVKSASFYDFSHTYLSLYEAYTKLDDDKQAMIVLGNLVAITTEYREELLPFLNDTLKSKGLEEAATLALQMRFNPRIIIAKETGHNEVVIRDENGELITRIETGTSGNNINVATADFDDDGEDEVVINVGKQIKIYKLNGDLIKSFSINQEGDIAVGNTNDDITPEILVTSKAANTNNVSIYAYDGKLLNTVNIDSLGKNTELSIVTKDIDNDGIVEIIAGNLKGNQVAIYKVDGTEINTFTVFQDSDTRTRAGKGKSSNDKANKSDKGNSSNGKPEKDNSSKGKPEKDNSSKSNKPEKDNSSKGNKPEKDDDKGKPVNSKGKTYGVNVAVGDIDGDGTPEIIVGTASKTNWVQVYSLNGELKAEIRPNFSNKKGVEITVGDLDKDGVDEIIIGDTAGTQVQVYKGDGTFIKEITGLDSKNIASISFGKGAVEITNPFPTESTPTTSETEIVEPDMETLEPNTEVEEPIEPNSETEEQTLTEEQILTNIDSEIEESTLIAGQPNIPEVKILDEITINEVNEDLDSSETSEIITTVTSSGIQLPTTGEIFGIHSYDGVTITDATINEKAVIANATLTGNINNQGILSNITVSEGAILDGGIVTGYIKNQGTITNIDYRGGQLTGGNLAGNIIVDKKYTRMNLGVFE
ncbi:MAG: FG-GAP-like repeat-containing protein, partial [Candidatus Marithrix sp.]